MKTEERSSAATEVVKCDVCLKEVPVSEAKNAEAADYVAHFCGLACFDKWRKQPEKR